MIGEIVLIIIGAIVSFLGMVICSFAKPTEKQKYSIITVFSAFSYFLIAFLNIYSEKIDSFVLLQRFSFVGGIYVMMGFAFAMSYAFDVSYSNRTKIIIVVISFVLVGIFTTFSDGKPWVKSIEIIEYEKCSLYYFRVHGTALYYCMNALCILLLVGWLIYIVVKSASKRGREFKVFRYLLGFALTPLFIWIFSMFKIIPSMLANEICFMIILIVIIYVEIAFSLAADKKLSIDNIIENTEHGIIILDYKKRFVYANSVSANLFEIIKGKNKDAITAFININLIGEEKYFDGENNYRIRIENIKVGETVKKGYVIWIER